MKKYAWVLAALLLFAATGFPAAAEINEYQVNATDFSPGTAICEFSGEVPQTLMEAFSHPKLEGWECLAGVYQERDRVVEAGEPSGLGLAAFAKDGERMLMLLTQDAETRAWSVLPVGEKALLPGRDFTIVYGGINSLFEIVYPLSDTGEEVFGCRLTYNYFHPETPVMCSLHEYRYTDTENQLEIVIDNGMNFSYADWFRVTTTRGGVTETAHYPAMFPGIMEYTDAAAFPKTAEECRVFAETSPTMPEGYGLTYNVHLRERASSHSADLGMYSIGTLVEVLGSEPGLDFPWYHVRIGVAEGYMSGNYVEYNDNQRNVSRDFVAGMGMLKKDVSLKENTGFFAGTVTKLPAGTVVRVLAERGNWLHVSVPGSEDDWLMRPGEVNGYVKRNDVLQAVTALQLHWLAD